MALVVEDGTGIANANSVATTQEAKDYATARGKSFTVADAVIDQHLLIAMDYLEAQRARYQGAPTFIASEQALQWPRTGVYFNGAAFSEVAIPKELKAAQIQLAMASAAGVELMPTFSKAPVKSRTVGPISTEYFEAYYGPTLIAVDTLLEPLFGSSGTYAVNVRA